MFDKKDKKNQEVFKYTENKRALVVNSTSSSRQSLRKSLSELGLNNSNILAVDSYPMAVKQLNTFSANIVICQYQIGETTYEDILEKHIKMYTNRLDTLFIITSTENSYAMSALVFETEVDAFIAVPFTNQSVLDTLLEIIKEKASPSKALYALEDYKSLYLTKKFTEMESIPSELAKDQQYNAIVAYYYSAAKKNNGDYTKAIETLKSGLEIDPIHYRCSRLLASIYFEQKKYKKAYELEYMLCKNYPIPPSRIPNLIKVSIATSNFKDIKNYHHIFKTLRGQSKELKRNIAAGMALGGKYLIQQGDQTDAEQMLKVAAEFCGGKATILNTIVSCLLSLNKLELVKYILTKCITEDTPEKDATILEFMLFAKENEILPIIKEAQTLIRKGMSSADVYAIYLEASITAGMTDDRVEDLYIEAKKAYPNNTSQFENIYRKVKP